jgi:hypothetical protein
VSSRLSLLAVAALLAGAIGGCADGKVKEANAYVNAVNAAQGGFAKTSERLLAAITPDSAAKQDRAVLTRFYTAVDRFVEQLRAIAPPARVRALHEKLTAAMVRFGTSLRTAGSDITSGKAGRIAGGQQQLASATASVSKTINATVAAINAALKG